MSSRILYSNFLFSNSMRKIVFEKGYLVYKEGISLGIFQSLGEIPFECKEYEVIDHSNDLMIPGFVDLHLHAPQYRMLGTGMDEKLIEWLNRYTFVEEAKFCDTIYAKEVYAEFVKELRAGFTTRACVFGTIHRDANKVLMDLLEESGLVTMVGKVNMDRNAPENLCEETAESIGETIEWIEESIKSYVNTLPILTPRFIPSCSDYLMYELGMLKKQYQIPLQSHLSENKEEINWVLELCKPVESYTKAYEERGCFDGNSKTIMAHCVYLSEDEQKILKEKQVFLAHCPDSNLNLSSGIAPISRYIEQELKIGLASDIAGGSMLNLLQVMRCAIQSSKMIQVYLDSSSKALTLDDVFYLATRGGGEFFGMVGSFEKGYEVDAVVVRLGDWEKQFDKSSLRTYYMQALEKLMYLGSEQNVVAKYIRGKKIF